MFLPFSLRQIIFSIAISLGHAKPADYGELEYDNRPHSVDDVAPRQDDDRPDDSVEVPSGNIYDTGIFTKYPDSPTDDGSYRRRRATSEINSAGEHDAHDSNHLFFEKVYNVSHPEPGSGAETSEVPLDGLISAIGTELVSSAENVNLDVSNRKQRSAENGTPPSVTEKSNDVIDLNKNFFDEIFEFTRAERETGKANDSNKTIPLRGLVQAVESTLVKSAQKLQAAAPSKSSNENVDTNVKERITRSGSADDAVDSGEEVAGKVLEGKHINLDLLKPITFKAAASASSESQESHESDEVTSTTPAPLQVQPTNLLVLHESNSTHIVPNANQATVHLQRQHISQTIFQSTLAILPTIPPNSVNVPAIATTTTATQTDAVTDNVDSSSQKQLNENNASDQKQKLKEEVAIVEATPIILSQGI